MATRRATPAKPTANTPVVLCADQLSAAAEFLRNLNASATATGVFPDAGFVVELPLAAGPAPRLRVEFSPDETDVEYVIGGLVSDG
jgi:hypothetical protein